MPLAGFDLLGKQPRSELAAFMAGNQIIDLVRQRPVPGVAAQDLVGSLRGLQPRLYSIASSAQFAEDEVHLCVSPLKFELHDRARRGVASGHLAEDLQCGDMVPVYVQRNDNFRLPDDPSAPIVIRMQSPVRGPSKWRTYIRRRASSR